MSSGVRDRGACMTRRFRGSKRLHNYGRDFLVYKRTG